MRFGGRLGASWRVWGVALGVSWGMGCALADLSLDDKNCPCVDGYRCDLASNKCVRGELLADASVDARVNEAGVADSTGDARDVVAPGDGGTDCAVHADKRLWCTNVPADLHASPDPASPVVNRLSSTYSWFDCWATGTLHAGGNTTWYHTFGDNTAASGYLPAVDLRTPAMFDADPSAAGLARCGL